MSATTEGLLRANLLPKFIKPRCRLSAEVSDRGQINSSKRFYIHTLGCKVNQYESQAMREILAKAGFKECISREMADIYIINTCTVTDKVDKESRHWIGFFHKASPKAKIVVTGCYTEKDSESLSFLTLVL